MTLDAAPAWLADVAALPGRLRTPADLAWWPGAATAPARPCAVLLLLADGPDGPDVLLTERATSLRSHAGQVSFPGGRIDPADAGPVAAALRETWEEAGVDPGGVEVLGTLPPLHLRVSANEVTPVLAWWRAPHPVAPVDVAEVAAVRRVPLRLLADPGTRVLVHTAHGYQGPGFTVGPWLVWGFTAELIDRVLTATGWARPWDRTRTMAAPLPQPVGESR